MHSILENDRISSNAFEVLCHMGTLIIEGRTPKTVEDLTTPGDSSVKSDKPYIEGPHCPTFMKLYNKFTHNNHKCTESNKLCIRYNNLKQNLQYLHHKSSTICIEVSLGPDCLCGELRSTLVSTQPCKRDVILEQWMITIGHKQMLQGSSSQMSVMNLYQAVRSLLHFSQLTAWYMCNEGMKPSNVIYRVGIPEDSTFISDDNFVSHDFPVADVNKTVSLKISVKTLPRMEKIPSVFCPQHPGATVEGAHGPHFEAIEPQKLGSIEKSYLRPESLHSKFTTENKDELLENKLPLKFQGARKKTHEDQERKRKKHITSYGSPSPLGVDNCSGAEFLDGLPVDVKKMTPCEEKEYFKSKRMFQRELLTLYRGESSKVDCKKSKPSIFSADISELVKFRHDFKSFDTFSCGFLEEEVIDQAEDCVVDLKCFSDSKSKSDFRTKGTVKNSGDSGESTPESISNNMEMKTVMDILDDRMQISCAISGKHHCKWECEEDSDLNNTSGNVEKPKRRRSLSKVKTNEVCEDVKLKGSDSEKILHGKFKEICNSELSSPLREGDEAREDFTFTSVSDPLHLSVTNVEFAPKPATTTSLDINNSLLEITSESQTPKIESLPFNEICGKSACCKEVSSVDTQARSSLETSQEDKGRSSWVRTESFESFMKGCAFTRDSSFAENHGRATQVCDAQDSESELSDETSNPFLAAILRTTRKSKALRDSKKCDSSSIRNKFSSDGKETTRGKNCLILEKSKDPVKSYTSQKMTELQVKDVEYGNVKSEDSIGEKKICCQGLRITTKNSDLRLSRKKPSCVKNFRNFDSEEVSGSSEFLSKNLTRLKSLFDTNYLKCEKSSDRYEELFDEISSNNLNSTKTIPVPSAHDKLKFRRSLDSAAQLVFHRCSGLPLTSSPAPVRRNNNSFSFDSSLNSVSAIKSALFEPSNSLSSEDENESEGSLKSPASPGAWSAVSKQINYHSLSPLPLLGSFEESVLNGRLEPVSTVQGFTAELGASGSFCPRHLHLPVTVFFYTLGDNDKVSAPYLGHINLGKKGYNVPRSGTIQVTLFNPMRTVVKMFVVVYDLHDMPANSHTFLRQRTLYVPASQKESTFTDKKESPFDQEDYHKYLRYLIHLRFVSGKTGRIYLHTDIRMVIFRKADEDTATALGNKSDGETFELRSHTHVPINPKFSPRK